MMSRDQKPGDSTIQAKHPGQSKRVFTQTPEALHTASYNLPSEDLTISKPNQLQLPILNEEDPSQEQTPQGQFFPGRAFLPLMEEEDQDAFEDHYSLQKHQIPLGNQGYHGMGKADSPSNYKPFGTHFGPRVLTRYGHSDFLTPQARTVMSHQYGVLPGDSSSRSSPFKKNGQLPAKTQPVISNGFASFAEHAARRRTVENEEDAEAEEHDR